MGSLLAGLSLLAFFSCSPSTPQIIRDFSRLTYLVEPEASTPRESLSLFLQIENKDGVEDIEKLFVLNDKDELFWTLEPGQWQRKDQGSEIWIGSNFLFNPLGEIPRGEYRIILQSRSGERARSKVYLDSPKLSEYKPPFPQITLDPNGVTVVNPPASYELWLAAADGKPLFTYRSAGESRVPIEAYLPTQDLKQRARQLTFHRFEDRLGVSIILGPYPISP